MSVEVTTRANPEAADVAVILPGTGYTVQAPLLSWPARMLAERGWQLREVTWTIDDAAQQDPARFVGHAVADAFGASTAAGRRLVVAKSFGTFALPWARAEGVPGVWLTPVTTAPEVQDALRAATPDDLAIGGDVDPLWLPERLAGTRARTVTVPGADHALAVAGGWRATLGVQSAVFDEIDAHFDRL
jgi:hypothetical protein